MRELPDALHAQIRRYCSEGDELAGKKDYELAVQRYNSAWELVPEPKQEWEASTWILAAIGDACFSSAYLTSAREALEFALCCPDGLGNPFIHLRLGQVLLEQGEQNGAAEHLMRAYMGAGDDIFADCDAKYREFLASHAELD